MDMPERFIGVSTVNSFAAGSIVKEVKPTCKGNMAPTQKDWLLIECFFHHSTVRIFTRSSHRSLSDENPEK
ncbi:hypothetical protein TNCT_125791 [Trichonephila clavata]|uniref:Uncharacterized protein n=1 Tax=Trichonephila clavata TaxID=2740835 RepID=A0A8X6GPD6_TRICU|nr:hypothetical protein TNCT_125791 [Trichonephila clavata]